MQSIISDIQKQFSKIISKHFLGVLTRCKDEYFVAEFCRYYRKQGVDMIFIVDDNSNNTAIYKNIKDPCVKIFYAKGNTPCHNIPCAPDCTCNRVLANEIYKTVKDCFEWMIYVDVDEFIATRKQPKITIRQQLQKSYKNVDCISVPWIMMSPVGKTNPESVLKTNIYRINYNKKPKHVCNSKFAQGKFSYQSNGTQVQCKPIFRCKFFDGVHDKNDICDHRPRFPNKEEINWVESVRNTKVSGNYKEYHRNITERIIRNATFLCYHYRVISEEHAINKLKTNSWYIKNGYSLSDLLKYEHNVVDKSLATRS